MENEIEKTSAGLRVRNILYIKKFTKFTGKKMAGHFFLHVETNVLGIKKKKKKRSQVLFGAGCSATRKLNGLGRTMIRIVDGISVLQKRRRSMERGGCKECERF